MSHDVFVMSSTLIFTAYLYVIFLHVFGPLILTWLYYRGLSFVDVTGHVPLYVLFPLIDVIFSHPSISSSAFALEQVL